MLTSESKSIDICMKTMILLLLQLLLLPKSGAAFPFFQEVEPHQQQHSTAEQSNNIVVLKKLSEPKVPAAPVEDAKSLERHESEEDTRMTPLDVVRGVITQIKEEGTDGELKDFHEQIELQAQNTNTDDELAPVERARIDLVSSSVTPAFPAPSSEPPNDEKVATTVSAAAANEEGDMKGDTLVLNDSQKDVPNEVTYQQKISLPIGEEKQLKMEREKIGGGTLLVRDMEKVVDQNAVKDNGTDVKLAEKESEPNDGQKGEDSSEQQPQQFADESEPRLRVLPVAELHPIDASPDRKIESSLDHGNSPQDYLVEEEGSRDHQRELTMWQKIVLGLRCARHDCRDTLSVDEEGRRIINGWKITRRARAMDASEENSDEEAGRSFPCPCRKSGNV